MAKKEKTTYELILEQIEKASNNPMMEAIQKMEADRKTLIDNATSQWYDSSMQRTIKDYEETLKSASQAFSTIDDYASYANPLISSLELGKFKEAQEALKYIQPQYDKTYLSALSTIEDLKKTISSTSVQSVLPELSGLSIYEDTIKKATESIATNQSLLDATKSLSEVRHALIEDSFKQNIEDNIQANRLIEPIYFEPIRIPDNPLVKQNEKILEQNNEIIKLGKLQNKSLTDISEYTQEQNKDIKKQNGYIEDQINQKDIEIEANRKTSRNTLIIAIISIVLSIVASYMSYKATYDVYEKEKQDNNDDNKVLLEAINNKTTQNNQLSLLVKEMEQQNKLIEEQNTYLKSLLNKKKVKKKAK
ncbi:MAG: hypothetical protein WC665_09775 [Sulfurimonas sp.]|jgi:hypothetical protein